MFFKQLELTTALRPALSPDETLLFVQDAVGLYDGKYKLPDHQKGHAYLTSLRICYIDDENPRQHSLALELRDVDKIEIQAGFLRSSAKITFHPKPVKKPFNQKRLSTSGVPSLSSSPSRDSSPISRTASPFQSSAPAPLASGTWICPICSYSNPIPSNFDVTSAGPHTTLPPCLACGIPPPLATILKAAIAANTSRPPLGTTPTQRTNDFIHPGGAGGSRGYTGKETVDCPRCTFSNHASMLACEICGAPLLVSEDLHVNPNEEGLARPESPGPQLERLVLDDTDYPTPVKLSFRTGGEKIFHERLKGAMIQRKWLLRDAPPVPKLLDPQELDRIPSQTPNSNSSQSPRTSLVGIAGLERRGLEARKKNERVIGGAFEDLEALMVSAKEVLALAETFAKETNRSTNTSSDNDVLSSSAAALGMVTTKDLLGSGSTSESLYISELSRNLAEYLTDDTRGILQREGGIMSLVDLWAIFNGSRNGVELVSPSDFEKAAHLWEKLKLPVRLRRFKSGLLVVQRTDRSDEKTIQQFQSWLRSFSTLSGVTAQETAMHFGWSVGVASEELEMAEERGALCREGNVEGLRFWENLLVVDEDDVRVRMDG